MIKSVMVDGVEALKMMVDGKLAWERGGLPIGYQPCEYIQSVGGQYIDTGVEAMETIGFTIDVRVDAYVRERGLLAASDDTDKTHYVLQSHNNALRLYLSIVTNTMNVATYQSDADFHSVTYNANGSKEMLLDGVSLGFAAKNYSAVSKNLYLFCRHRRSNASDFGMFSVKKAKLYDNGILIRNFVPCLDKSGVPCMYDMVSRKPFYNQGTGEFLYELA